MIKFDYPILYVPVETAFLAAAAVAVVVAAVRFGARWVKQGLKVADGGMTLDQKITDRMIGPRRWDYKSGQGYARGGRGMWKNHSGRWNK